MQNITELKNTLEQPKRPTFVTAYAVWLAVSTLFTATFGLLLGGALGSPTIVIVALLIATGGALVANGLWQLKQWAKTNVVRWQGLKIAVSLLFLIVGPTVATVSPTYIWEPQATYSVGTYMIWGPFPIGAGMVGFHLGVTNFLFVIFASIVISGWIIAWFGRNETAFTK